MQGNVLRASQMRNKFSLFGGARHGSFGKMPKALSSVLALGADGYPFAIISEINGVTFGFFAEILKVVFSFSSAAAACC